MQGLFVCSQAGPGFPAGREGASMSTGPNAGEASGGTSADVPPFRYTAALADQIETTWQRRWADESTYAAPNPAGPLADGFDRVAITRHAYIMDMFPYPSGA